MFASRMSPSRLRWFLIGAWIALTCTVFAWIGSLTARSWMLLFVSGAIPAAMVLWLWNQDQPQLLGPLRSTPRRP
jgi:hypothetical protein